MTNSESITDARAQFEQAVAGLKIPGTELPGVPQQLVDAATRAGNESHVVSVIHVTQYASGKFSVHIDDIANNVGFIRYWPQWAADIAKTALLSGKHLWVISFGDPGGDNLLAVTIMNS